MTSVRRVDAVAILEAERRRLREWAIVDGERCAGLRYRLKRDVAAPVFASCSTSWRWLNVPRSLSCPARRMGVAVGQDGGEGQRLRRRPVDVRTRASRWPHAASRSRSSFFGVKHPDGAPAAPLFAQQRIDADAVLATLATRRRRLGSVRPAPPGREPASGLHRPASERSWAARPPPASLGDNATRTRAWSRVDGPAPLDARRSGVDQRLREGWLVALVVALAPVADEVDQEILWKRSR